MDDSNTILCIVVAVVIMVVVLFVSADIRKVQLAKYKCEVTNND